MPDRNEPHDVNEGDSGSAPELDEYDSNDYDRPELTSEELEEIREAKFDSIRLHFETHYEPKVRRIRELYEGGDQDEAFLLALCYVDGIATWLLNEDSPRRRFAKLLHEHGGVERLREIPKKPLRGELTNALRSDKKLQRRVTELSIDIADFVGEINGALDSNPADSFTLESAESLFVERLGMDKAKVISPELYRATNAGLLYKFYRNPMVHALGLHEVDLILPDGKVVSFGLWDAIPSVSFEDIQLALENCLAEAKRRSLEAACLFESDRVGEPRFE